MATYFDNIDFSKLSIGPIETGNNGGKYMKVSYNGDQLKNVQLGVSVHDTLRCPFGSEPVSQDQPNKLCIKVEVSDKLKKFVESIDALVKNAVKDDSLTHGSTLREGSMTTLKLKIMQDTQIFVTTLKDNKITPPKPATVSDITPNSQVLPIMKIQGGVYFIENRYGTSMVATQILVVNGVETQQPSISFSLGNDVMISED